MKKIRVGKRAYSKIAALVLGLIVWTIIINVEDADFSAKINNVTVQISGETVLEDNDLVVANKGEIGEAGITVRGKRSDVINYMDDIYATADVSKITEPGEYNIRVSYDTVGNTLYITDRKTNTVKIVVEKMQKKELEVLALQKGATADSGKIIKSTPKAEKITVRGTAADLEKIEYAAVEVDASGTPEDSLQELPIITVDAQQKALTFKNNVYLSVDKTEVTNEVYNRLTVPVNVEVNSDTDDAFIIVSQSLEKIDVGITEGSELQEVKAVINYNSAEGTNYRVELEAEEGVYIPWESKEIEVELKVVPRVTETVTVPLSINAEEGDEISAPSQITLEVTGAEEEVSVGNITASVKIAGLESGVHTLPIDVEFKKTSLSVVGTPTVTLTVK